MTDFLFRGSLADLDPDLHELTEIEAERQTRKLILIPSESQAPLAVRQALSSAFQNIYAEGYPDPETRWMDESEILDFDARLAHFRRYSDPRYYKGVEYADIVEALARRRCAELFATDDISADEIYVNVQPLSGAPANNAIYHALVEPGETIMGMSLLHGGHLTHGSSVNRSGKFYHAVHYTVDRQTERIDYDAVEQLALETRPKFIIAGYSSYPWSVDWARFRAIADTVGAYLFADIAHVAGLVAGGVYPSPLGFADVITFTTHKSLCGPRGACILTTDRSLSRKIDRAVFPGEQGGPHINVFAAMALAFKLDATPQFAKLQQQIVKNNIVFTKQLEQRGFRIPYGGTDTHLMNLDCSTISGPDGATLSGDQAARILDIAGIVVNRNTIPGDKSALDPSGIRMGTPWVTQRGLKESDMVQLADLIADVLYSSQPFLLEGRRGDLRRAKVDFSALEHAKLQVRDMAQKAGVDFEPSEHGYPHFYYLDDSYHGEFAVFDLSGERVREFVNFALSSDAETLAPGQSQATRLFTAGGEIEASLTAVDDYTFRLTVPAGKAGLAAAWLRDLSDGYIAFDDDLQRKLPGPVSVQPSSTEARHAKDGEAVAACKPYFVCMPDGSQDQQPLPAFSWQEVEADLRRTPIFEVHQELGAKIIPFAGWEMPVWYTGVIDEHNAVRKAAGLFDVAHMGVFEISGPNATEFLDLVLSNYARWFDPGESYYSYLMDQDGKVIDDLMVYRRGEDLYLMVVNAANADKDWAWLNAVNNGEVLIDRKRPDLHVLRPAVLRDLKDPACGSDMRVDLALQGPASLAILQSLAGDWRLKDRLARVPKTGLIECELGGPGTSSEERFELVIARTGYTGEDIGYEIFVHPDRAVAFWETVLDAGEPFGVQPCGLAARDSTRTEAGLPLYGHELAGPLDISPVGAGFGSYVKLHKPYFVGRTAHIEREKTRKLEVARFRMNERGVRMPKTGDPVVNRRGRAIGWVTSAAVDVDGRILGLAYIESRYHREGDEVDIFTLPSRPLTEKDNKADLEPGDKIQLPDTATILLRFPEDDERSHWRGEKVESLPRFLPAGE